MRNWNVLEERFSLAKESVRGKAFRWDCENKSTYFRRAFSMETGIYVFFLVCVKLYIYNHMDHYNIATENRSKKIKRMIRTSKRKHDTPKRHGCRGNNIPGWYSGSGTKLRLRDINIPMLLSRIFRVYAYAVAMIVVTVGGIIVVMVFLIVVVILP